MPKLAKSLFLFLFLALVLGFASQSYAAPDPEGVPDSIWIEVPNPGTYPDSVVFQIRLMTDNTGSNQIAAFGLPFLITVDNNGLVMLDTTVARTFNGSAASGFAIKSAGTDATGGADPTVSPVEFVVGGIDFGGGLVANSNHLLASIKLNLNANANQITIDTFHTGTLSDPQFTTAFVVDYIPRWIPAPPFLFLEVKDVQKGTTAIPEQFGLDQNYPNPFNATTLIQFALPKSGHVKLEVFNVLGQKVNTLVDEELTAGYKQILWDGTDHRGISVASGIYFYRIKAGNLFTEMKKMVMLK